MVAYDSDGDSSYHEGSKSHSHRIRILREQIFLSLN